MRRTSTTIGSFALAWMVLTGPAAAQATYQLSFQATWSEATHPVDFPGDAHFSPLVGGTHGPAVSFWSSGAIASSGMERMAELGQTATLLAEVGAAIGAGTAGAEVLGGGADSPGSATATVTVTQAHPLATVVTMIAPSPDWFVGVTGLDLSDGVGGWQAEVVVPLGPYDAGTDSGTTFASPNADTVPAEPISALTGFPFTGTGPLGTFTFTLVDVGPGCIDDDVDGYGSPASAACTFPGLDCDDTDPAVNPGAAEIPGNGVDDDCDPSTPRGCQQMP